MFSQPHGKNIIFLKFSGSGMQIESRQNTVSIAVGDGSIQGYALSRRSPKLTHLLFADDRLLFCRSSRNECHKVLEIKASYESMPSQQIN